MPLNIVQAGDPILRQVARELTLDEIHSRAIQQLITVMKNTMYDAPGVGLAAPQIGESLQLIVIEDRADYLHAFSAAQLKARERVPVPFQVIINPKITFEDRRAVEFYEGCLSVAGWVSLVPRAAAVTVDCLNERGMPITIAARGWYARILQHEIDHLQGKLCIDRMRPTSLTTVENYNKFWKKDDNCSLYPSNPTRRPAACPRDPERG